MSIKAGRVGGYILKTLLSSPLTITILSRPESKSTFPENVKVIKKEHSDPTLHESFAGQDAIISTVGGAAILDQIKIIDAAAKAGIRRFIISEWGSDTLNPVFQKGVFFYTQKKAVLDHLDIVVKENPGFSWTGICCGPFLDWFVFPKYIF